MNVKKYLSIDVESDGLYGDAFAIGAVVMDEHGNTLDTFGGLSSAEAITSQWVIENVLPHLTDLNEFESRHALREAFWQFYMQWKDDAVVMADVPCPVEAGLFRQCVLDDPEARNFLAPFPLIDVASVLFTKGLDPLLDRIEYCGMEGRRHHPVDDARASCLCLLTALGSIGR